MSRQPLNSGDMEEMNKLTVAQTLHTHFIQSNANPLGNQTETAQGSSVPSEAWSHCPGSPLPLTAVPPALAHLLSTSWELLHSLSNSDG